MNDSNKNESDKLEPGTLIQLLELQAKDDHIVQMEGRRSSRPGELSASKRRLAEHESRATESKGLVQSTQKRIDEQTLVAESLKADSDKLEGQLYNLKSNDEFEMMKSQIKVKQEREMQVQDKILELMMALDELKEAAAKRDSEFEADKARHAKVEAGVEEQLTQLERDIASEKQLREEAASKLDAELLALYENVCERREKKGLAAVDAESETCTGCHTQVMMQTVNAVMGGNLVQCPHCDRILYLRSHAAE